MTELFLYSSYFQAYLICVFCCMCVPPAVLPNPDWLLGFFVFTDNIHLPFSESSWTDWLKQVN